MRQYNIGEHLSFNELALIVGDPDDVDYDNLPAETKERYDRFAEAWATKASEEYAPEENPFA